MPFYIPPQTNKQNKNPGIPSDLSSYPSKKQQTRFPTWYHIIHPSTKQTKNANIVTPFRPSVHSEKPPPPDRPASISAMHPPRARGLLARTAGDGSLELEESTADLVADGRVPLLVLDMVVVPVMMGRGNDGRGVGAAAEDAPAAGGGGCRNDRLATAVREERHVCFMFDVLFGI